MIDILGWRLQSVGFVKQFPSLGFGGLRNGTRGASWFSRVRRLRNRTVQHECPPVAEQIHSQEIIHGRLRVDEFKWLENIQDKATLAYCGAESRYAEQQLKDLQPLSRRILKELQSYIPRSPPNDPPDIIDGWEYSNRWVSGRIVYVRRPISGGNEEILLDTRFLPQGSTSVKKCLISNDHKVLAYLICGPTEEQGTLYFRDLTRPPSLKNIAAVPKVFNFVWADGHRTVYYTRLDELLRANEVFRHRLYAFETTDELVYHEPEPTCFLDVSITKDKKYVTINSSSSSDSKVLVVSTEGSKSEQPRLVLPRLANTQYYVDHHEDAFYILHNHISDNFSLSLFRDSVLGKVSWDKLQPVVTTSESEKLEELELFRNFALLYMKKGGLPVLECHDFRTDERHTVPLDEPIASVYTGSNLKYDTSIVHFNTSSPLTMQSVYEYDMDKKIMRKKGTRSPAGFDVRQYVVKRITVPSDTADIPVTLIHNKNLERNGQNPVNIRAYGAYGVPFEPYFRLEILPLLRRGFVVALAHVRGGSDLGVRWYKEGRLLQKENSFKDLIAVADFMVREKYSHPNLLTGHGVSAGGLLMATVMNRRPDLFRAMVLRVPFVDPLSAMLDRTSPLTTVERGEWGDPLEDPAVYEYMAGYAPYDGIPFANSGSTDFKTSVLITASLQDQRVALWQPLKYVARMRARNSTVYGSAAGLAGKDVAPSAATPKLLLKIYNDRGHNASGDEVNLEDGALESAFLIREIEPFLENISTR